MSIDIKPTIAILFGGASPEYAVSLQSAAAVIAHIDSRYYDIILLGIDRSGRWFLYEGDIQHIRDDTWQEQECCRSAIVSPDRGTHGILVLDGQAPRTLRLDACLPVLHGSNGEDGTVQGLLELAGVPIIGCGSASSAICMDKDAAHTLVASAGIAVPRGCTLSRPGDIERAREAAAAIGYPLIVKPLRGGSSLGISVVHRDEELAAALHTAEAYDQRVLLEEMIEGIEVGCAILGWDDRTLAGRVDEIELRGDFFDFYEKYHLDTARIHMPARIDTDQEEAVRHTALRIYQLLGCSGFARVDMFLRKDGSLLFNEVNTIPGFTEHSRYPHMLAGIGLSFAEVIAYLLKGVTGV